MGKDAWNSYINKLLKQTKLSQYIIEVTEIYKKTIYQITKTEIFNKTIYQITNLVFYYEHKYNITRYLKMPDTLQGRFSRTTRPPLFKAGQRGVTGEL